jgi:tRNA threonylcarbamoyl adenosine modification protein YjeE
LYHIDLYRIERPTDLKTVGVEEFLTDKGAVSAIEWPGKIEDSLPERTIKIKIETLGENKRKIRVGD